MKISIFFLLLISTISGCKNEQVEIGKIQGKQIQIDQIFSPDSSITEFILPYKNELQHEISTILCYNPKILTRTDGDLESALGNIYADICFHEADSIFKSQTGKNIDFALFNYGGIRTVIPKGNVTVGNIFELMPFENKLVIVELSGTQTVKLFNYLKDSKKAHPISNLKLTLKEASFKNILIQDKPFDPTRNYYVLTHDYLQHGGDNMSFFKEPVSLFSTQYKVRDAIIDYLVKIDTIKAQKDGRFVKIN